MLELNYKVDELLRDIAKNGCPYKDTHSLDYCCCCLLDNFDNTKNSCQENAKELLQLMNLQKYAKTLPFRNIYSEGTLKGWSKEELIGHIKCLQHNYMTISEAFDRQSNILIKFFTEQKGKMKITLEYKEK